MNFLEEIDLDEMVRPRLKGVPCSPVTHSLSLPPHHRVQNIVSSRTDNQFLSTHLICCPSSFVEIWLKNSFGVRRLEFDQLEQNIINETNVICTY